MIIDIIFLFRIVLSTQSRLSQQYKSNSDSMSKINGYQNGQLTLTEEEIKHIRVKENGQEFMVSNSNNNQKQNQEKIIIKDAEEQVKIDLKQKKLKAFTSSKDYAIEMKKQSQLESIKKFDEEDHRKEIEQKLILQNEFLKEITEEDKDVADTDANADANGI